MSGRAEVWFGSATKKHKPLAEQELHWPMAVRLKIAEVLVLVFISKTTKTKKKKGINRDILYMYIHCVPAVWWKLIHHKVNWPNAVLRRLEKGYPISIDLKTYVDFALLFLICCPFEKSITSEMPSVEQSILNVFNSIGIALAPCNGILEKIKYASLLKNNRYMQTVLLKVKSLTLSVMHYLSIIMQQNPSNLNSDSNFPTHSNYMHIYL